MFMVAEVFVLPQPSGQGPRELVVLCFAVTCRFVLCSTPYYFDQTEVADARAAPALEPHKLRASSRNTCHMHILQRLGAS